MHLNNPETTHPIYGKIIFHKLVMVPKVLETTVLKSYMRSYCLRGLGHFDSNGNHGLLWGKGVFLVHFYHISNVYLFHFKLFP